MDNSISKLLGDEALPPEMLATLQEAFDKRVAEAHQQAEVTVREDMARRYEQDKENLVEAMDRMLTDVVQQHVTEKNGAVAKFIEARGAFRRAVKETRGRYETKLSEGMTQSRKVVTEALRKEIAKLHEQKKLLVAEKLASADKLHSMKEAMARMYAKRIRKIDEFVVRQVRKELGEFDQDHRSLVATRVKLVTEGRKRLRETQTRFVKQAARQVETVVNQSLKHELTQLHEDLERNRQNMFGRRIFEAVAAEYLTSYLAEGTEIRNLQNMLESVTTESTEAKAKLTEAIQEKQIASRKARLFEDRATRSKVMGELLSNLRGEKRTVMEGMLDTVKTEALRPTFNKLLPVVLNEAAPRPVAPAAAERRQPAAVVTGKNQHAARLFETAQAETNNDFTADIAQVVRLAGIQR